MTKLMTMELRVQETNKAFRINGVTFAKRHLENAFGRDTSDTQKMLARYLLIVPFLHEAYIPPDNANETIRYGAKKAHRLYEAIGLNDEADLPFMLVALKLAGEDATPEAVRSVGTKTARGFGAESKDVSFREGERDNVVSFAQTRGSHTLH